MTLRHLSEVRREPTVGAAPSPIRIALAVGGRACGRRRHSLEGLAAKSIARRLELSQHTVNDHLGAVYRKLGVSGRDRLFASLRHHASA